MPVKSGSTVQLQTARTDPEIEAIEYEIYFFVLAPKYFNIDCFDTKTAIAPAIKNAGIRHVRTCAERYSCNASIPEMKISIGVINSL